MNIEADCTWQQNADDCYETTCGRTFSFWSGGPNKHEFEFCPFCGRQVQEKEFAEETEVL